MRTYSPLLPLLVFSAILLASLHSSTCRHVSWATYEEKQQINTKYPLPFPQYDLPGISHTVKSKDDKVNKLFGGSHKAVPGGPNPLHNWFGFLNFCNLFPWEAPSVVLETEKCTWFLSRMKEPLWFFHSFLEPKLDSVVRVHHGLITMLKLCSASLSSFCFSRACCSSSSNCKLCIEVWSSVSTTWKASIRYFWWLKRDFMLSQTYI